MAPSAPDTFPTAANAVSASACDATCLFLAAHTRHTHDSMSHQSESLAPKHTPCDTMCICSHLHHALPCFAASHTYADTQLHCNRLHKNTPHPSASASTCTATPHTCNKISFSNSLMIILTSRSLLFAARSIPEESSVFAALFRWCMAVLVCTIQHTYGQFLLTAYHVSADSVSHIARSLHAPGTAPACM